MPEDPEKSPTLFGRQKSKKLSRRQQGLVNNLFPKIKITPAEISKSRQEWIKAKPLVLEIGFGGGEHLSAQAANHKDIHFIGCEPFINGIAKMLVAIEENDLDNVLIYDNDARHILKSLPDQSLDKVYILYPDPWPKTRHRKRRFVTRTTLKLLASKMKSGAQLLIASDIGDYIRTSLIALDQSPEFIWKPSSSKDWKQPPVGWPGTRYEQKALREGRTPTYLKIKRR